MRIKLSELQDNNKNTKKLKLEGLSEGWKNIKEMLHYQGFPYILKVIYSELISRYQDNPLADHFGIEKTQELIARKCYWLTLQRDIEAYIKAYNICLTSKTVCYKSYSNLQSLPIPTYWWKDLSRDFIMDLPISANWKSDSYNPILVIIDWLIKMVYYKLVKVTINTLGLAEVIINVIIHHHGVLEAIVID